MKPRIFLTLTTCFFTFLVLCNTSAFSNNDTLKKKHSVFVSSYVSALLTNDLSLAVEHNYKRFRHELGFLYKALDWRKNYIYEKGYGLNYHIKYNLVSNKKVLLSADLGYIYRKAEYDNKIDAMEFYVSTDGLSRYGSFYRMDKRNTYSGISFGISNLTRIYKKLLFGFNLYFNTGEAYQKSIAREYIRGEMLREAGPNSSPVNLPHTIEKRNWQFGVTALFKIAWQL